MSESVPDWKITDARTALDDSIHKAVEANIRHGNDEVNAELEAYAAAAHRAAIQIEICYHRKMIANAEAKIVQANESIEYLKKKL